MTVEHLSSDAFLTLWRDPLCLAKRRSEAEHNINYAPCCGEVGCVCGQVAELQEQFNNSPVITFSGGYFSRGDQ